jgi:molecular chaperone GrpE (heat shock protein)
MSSSISPMRSTELRLLSNIELIARLKVLTALIHDDVQKSYTELRNFKNASKRQHETVKASRTVQLIKELIKYREGGEDTWKWVDDSKIILDERILYVITQVFTDLKEAAQVRLYLELSAI